MSQFRDNLKRLFTRNVVMVRLPGGRIKTFDVNKTQSSGSPNPQNYRSRWRNGRNFSSVSGYGSGFVNHEVEAMRKQMYLDYELMDSDAIISSAIDVISDEVTSNSADGDLLVINCDDEKIKKLLNNLFYDVLNIEFNLWHWVRQCCKYGDFFLYLQVEEKFGVVNVLPIHPSLMTREEGTNEDPSEVKFRYEGDGQFYTVHNSFDQYEIAHFRLITDTNFLPYGKSVVEAARKEFKKLCLPGFSNIWTPQGHTKMEDIKPNDEIFSFDIKSNKPFKSKVKHFFKTGEKEVFEISLTNRRFYGTAEHPYLTTDGQYKEIKDLTTDDYIIIINGSNQETDPSTQIKNEFLCQKIISIKSLGVQPVYDIEVDNSEHNFIVDGVVAHNCLAEDAMLLHRIMRAPERRIFKIDVGNIPNNEIDSHIEQIANEMKKVPYMDPSTGEFNLRFNLLNSQEDFFLPVRGGQSGTSIETLPGLSNEGQIEDIEYLRSKMMSALKVPKAYLNYDDSDSKATLTSIDVRFARMIERVQKIVVSELYKIAVIHLHSQGFTNDELLNFELSLTSPSLIYDRQKIDLLNEKFNLITNMLETNLVSDMWIYENVLGFTKSEIEQEKLRLPNFLKEKFRYTQITDEGNDPKSTGRTFGTPHDIASMQVASKFDATNSSDLKKLYSPDERENNEGQPYKYKSFETAKDKEYGRDPFGRRDLDKGVKERFIKGLPKQYQKVKQSLTEEKIDDEPNLLNENQLLEDGE